MQDKYSGFDSVDVKFMVFKSSKEKIYAKKIIIFAAFSSVQMVNICLQFTATIVYLSCASCLNKIVIITQWLKKGTCVNNMNFKRIYNNWDLVTRNAISNNI